VPVVLGMIEQRHAAVLEVLVDGATVTAVARRFGVSRQTVHRWLRRYAAAGLAGLADRSSTPGSTHVELRGDRPPHPATQATGTFVPRKRVTLHRSTGGTEFGTNDGTSAGQEFPLGTCGLRSARPLEGHVEVLHPGHTLVL
jgi:transposase-like protein